MTATVQQIDAAGAAEGVDVGAMLKDGAAAAVLTFLSVFSDHHAACRIGQRRQSLPDLAAMGASLILCVARLRGAHRGLALSARARSSTRPRRASRGALGQRGLRRRATSAVFGIVVLFVFPLVDDRRCSGAGSSLKWIDSYGIQILIYVMLGWGLNIVVGLAGLLDLGYVAFYAVGAYAYALLATSFGLSFWICLPLAGILAAFWGIILGFPVLRLRGDYLAIVTLAFGEIIRLVLINWIAVFRRLRRHRLDPARSASSASRCATSPAASPTSFISTTRRSRARCSSITSSCVSR